MLKKKKKIPLPFENSRPLCTGFLFESFPFALSDHLGICYIGDVGCGGKLSKNGGLASSIKILWSVGRGRKKGK